ncbi:MULTISPECIES: gas vesicle protein [unclassified Streptosporangium]|uniref:gas vesicle protein n=1 Tax=Streptosporangium sp. NBC_01639 TaxID=2975948 RepID=UPI002DDB9121|nr:gas vesicle protein [Streptosporangium sp. NBC_01756]
MAPQSYGSRPSSAGGSANLGDILERVLDRGVVIVGDIRVNLLEIELLTIKLRLLIASVDTARELGIDWWERDPWLSSQDGELAEENRRLRERLAVAEGRERRRPIEPRKEAARERPSRARERGD